MPAVARPGDAQSAQRVEPRAVRGAEQVPAVAGEEPIGNGLERGADMRAGIDEGAQLPLPAHHHQLDHAPVRRARRDPLAAGIADLVEPAEDHAAIPAILQIAFHSAAPTGLTEIREWRTTISPAKRLSALSYASVTGVFAGASGATSTSTQRPVGSVGSGRASPTISIAPTTAFSSPVW